MDVTHIPLGIMTKLVLKLRIVDLIISNEPGKVLWNGIKTFVLFF